MKAQKISQGETKTAQEVMTFQFSESKQEIRNLLIESKPWFVAKDACGILDLNDTNKALQKLDDDEKLTRKIFVSGQNRKMWFVSESGLYALILRSNKPQAKAFRKWITNEVIPALLKKGYYAMHRPERNYIDARNVPYFKKEVNGFQVRCIDLEGKVWVSVNDVNRSIGANTDSGQCAKKLNAIEQLAQKIWLYGNTHPAWFTNQLGVDLILSGSRKLRNTNQLKLTL